MFPAPSTPAKSGVLLIGEAAVTGADQRPPARLRAIAIRPPERLSIQTAPASPERPSAITGLAPASAVASEITAGPCQAAAPALATAASEQTATVAATEALDGAESAHPPTLAPPERRFNALPVDLARPRPHRRGRARLSW